jgi:pimeloyl-ACP methyl ester carboxylesterase
VLLNCRSALATPSRIGHYALFRSGAGRGVRVVPEIRYAKHGDVHIAYCVEGEGPIDVVVVGHWLWSIVEAHRAPAFFDALGQFARVISYDQRGTGRSDPVAMDTMASLDQWLDDLVVVMDAAECEQAVLYGYDAAGPLAALCAATYPERTAALILGSTFARVTRTADYPCGIESSRVEHLVPLDGGELRGIPSGRAQ